MWHPVSLATFSPVKIGSKTYNGPLPFSNKNAPSPIRKITTTFPITSATDADMNCGKGAVKAAQVATVNPGDKVTLSWKSGQNKNWGHSLGPIMTYLAQVPAGQTADKFDTKNAKFFKIDQTGQTGGAGTGWVQASIKNGKTYTLTLPANLPAGDYIMRHELIALHFAQKKDGAQFYPGCVQLRVGGGSAAPKASHSSLIQSGISNFPLQAISAQTVSFPGGYTPNDKSLFVPDLFKNNFVYSFPGPALTKSISTASVASVAGTSAPGNSTTTEPEEPKTCNSGKSKREIPHVAPDHGRVVRSRARRHSV